MLDQLPATIFACLRRMDAEATTIRNGAPTGLNWYAAHARPELKKPQTEPEWSKRLARLLTDAGVPTRAEVPYPHDRRKRCDVVVTLPDDSGRVWIEIKGAWKHWWSQRGGLGIYRSYLFHPLLPGLIAKSHTVPNDLRKLSHLTPADARAAAMLLIGFDTPECSMDEDVEELVRLAGLHEPDWMIATDEWHDPWRSGQLVRCWYWTRDAE